MLNPGAPCDREPHVGSRFTTPQREPTPRAPARAAHARHRAGGDLRLARPRGGGPVRGADRDHHAARRGPPVVQGGDRARLPRDAARAGDVRPRRAARRPDGRPRHDAGPALRDQSAGDRPAERPLLRRRADHAVGRLHDRRAVRPRLRAARPARPSGGHAVPSRDDRGARLRVLRTHRQRAGTGRRDQRSHHGALPLVAGAAVLDERRGSADDGQRRVDHRDRLHARRARGPARHRLPDARVAQVRARGRHPDLSQGGAARTRTSTR